MDAPTLSAPGLTGEIAEFAAGTRFDDIPGDVMALGKKAILDVLGPALAGAASHTSATLRGYLAGVASPGAATVLGTGLRLNARFAALANGTSMHADDYDDTMQAATGKFEGIHPTNPVLAATLADAESAAAPVSGRSLLTAFHVGVEVACKIFDATAPQHILGGFHSTGSCAGLGASVGVARLRGLDAGRMRVILGIAASQAAGLSENFGTMTKPFHAGRSAETALMATDLAALGFTASTDIMEARRGFFQAYGGGWERERIEGRLGHPWSFVDRGIWLKMWPTGSLAHPAMTLFTELVQQNDLHAADIARVRIRTSQSIHNALKHHRPKTELEGKFSLEFCIASILLQRRLRLQECTDAYVSGPDIQSLIERIDYTTFDEAERAREGYTIVTSFGEIDTVDGRTLKGRRDYGKGSKADPMTDGEVEAKFRDCAAFCDWPGDKTDKVVTLVRRLEELADIRELTSCLAAS